VKSQISHKLQAFDGAKEQRGKNLVFELSPAPLHPCTPAQAQALRGVVRNPGLEIALSQKQIT
jgi:hypothetical protein